MDIGETLKLHQAFSDMERATGFDPVSNGIPVEITLQALSSRKALRVQFSHFVPQTDPPAEAQIPHDAYFVPTFTELEKART